MKVATYVNLLVIKKIIFLNDPISDLFVCQIMTIFTTLTVMREMYVMRISVTDNEEIIELFLCGFTETL